MNLTQNSSVTEQPMRHALVLSSCSLVLALAASACSVFGDRTSTTGDEHSGSTRASNLERVPDSLLAYVPEGQRTAIEEARAAESKARDESAAAERATQTSRNQLKIAHQELQIAEAEVKKAELADKLAEGGTQDDLDRAHKNVNEAHALMDATRARITWRERDIDSAKSDEDLQRAKQSLAAAHVELAKARAVRDLDRPEAKKIDVASFEHEVRVDEENVSIAHAKYESDRREMQIARGVFDDRSKAVPAAYRAAWDDDDHVIADKDQAKR